MAVSVRTLLAVAFHQYVQRHVEDYSKSCTASVAWLNRPNFDWQAWEITHRHPLQPLFFGLAKQKKHISTARNDKKRTPRNCHEKEQNYIQVCRNLTFDALCIEEVLHKCQRRHARFPVGRDVYVISCGLGMVMVPRMAGVPALQILIFSHHNGSYPVGICRVI